MLTTLKAADAAKKVDDERVRKCTSHVVAELMPEGSFLTFFYGLEKKGIEKGNRNKHRKRYGNRYRYRNTNRYRFRIRKKERGRKVRKDCLKKRKEHATNGGPTW